uniref:hypothetical protein n=1 Tax=Nonomuraea sp. NBC_01738 TaxID=2976003 RepID=UPI002E14CA5B|nr:hypothetical protein OIE66_30725 [Nonomuraea sp. NBC_01738]
MKPEQLAKLKAAADNTNTFNAMAETANGHGASREQARQADAALVAAVGPRKAKQLREDALVRHGAKPKGLSRFFG